MKIIIKNYRIECIIGIKSHERTQPQSLFIDLEFYSDFNHAINDEIANTVDYEKVSLLCKEIALNTKFNLLETLAQTILDHLFDAFPISRAKITIKKPEALKDADYAAIEIEREKKDTNNWGS